MVEVINRVDMVVAIMGAGSSWIITVPQFDYHFEALLMNTKFHFHIEGHVF